MNRISKKHRKQAQASGVAENSPLASVVEWRTRGQKNNKCANAFFAVTAAYRANSPKSNSEVTCGL